MGKIRTDEKIRIINGYDKDSYKYIPVVIVGAGESGIAMGCQLKEQLGFDQFRIFDRQSGAGGTWWINRYPGIACDIPCPFYSYSWALNKDAKELYPSGPELIRYFQKVIADYGIIDKIQLNADVSKLQWLEDEKQWEVTIRHMANGAGDLSQQDRTRLIEDKGEDAVYIGSEKIRARIAISAVGGLVEPREFPQEVKGWENFKGPLVHTARWKPDVDFAGKDVVVVGTGCSAAQTVPRLLKSPYHAKSVTQIMRTAPWVVPKADEPFGRKWYAENAAWWFHTVPGLLRLMRLSMFASTEKEWFNLFGGEPWNEAHRKEVEAKLIKHLHRTVPEKYHKMLTPNFSIGCKRRIFDSEWYPSFNDPAIHLTTQRLVSVGEDSVHLAAGGDFPDKREEGTEGQEMDLHADVIVLANGFDTAHWLHPLNVVGNTGRTLHEVWNERGGSQAYMGNAMDGFPNFFIIFGPNTVTGHSSVILATENMVNYTIKFLKPILTGEVETAEVKQEAEIEYTRRIQHELKGKVFQRGGCVSWYYEDNGWNSTTYSRSQIDFGLRCMFPKWSDWNLTLTEKGVAKKRLTLVLRLLAMAGALIAAYRFSQSKVTLKQLPSVLKMNTKMTLLALLGQLSAGIDRLQELV